MTWACFSRKILWVGGRLPDLGAYSKSTILGLRGLNLASCIVRGAIPSAGFYDALGKVEHTYGIEYM